MLPILVPALTQPAAAVPLAQAEALARLLDSYDRVGEGQPLHAPAVGPADRPVVTWLYRALTQDLPANPFPKGGAAHAEAEALRALLRATGAVDPARISALRLSEVGTQMALWRWGRRLDRAGRLPAAARRAFEDALLAVPEPTLASAYALRHALSYALGEADLARFTALKAAHGADAAEDFLGFQRLFGLLGSPGPVLRLWSLPALQPVEKPLQDLGGRRIWISPFDPAEATLPGADVAWVIPSAAGVLAQESPDQDQRTRREGEALARRLPGPRIWFAPGRADLEAYGLTFFPVLIELDGSGAVTAIRMGEAAPRRP